MKPIRSLCSVLFVTMRATWLWHPFVFESMFARGYIPYLVLLVFKRYYTRTSKRGGDSRRSMNRCVQRAKTKHSIKRKVSLRSSSEIYTHWSGFSGVGLTSYAVLARCRAVISPRETSAHDACVLEIKLAYTQRIRSRLFGAADVRDRQTEKQMSDSVIA